MMYVLGPIASAIASVVSYSTFGAAFWYFAGVVTTTVTFAAFDVAVWYANGGVRCRQ